MTSPLRVLISADMEGISGIVHPVETNPGSYDYERGRELMTAEVNAVIEGVLAAESTADVLVADAHAYFRNLLPEKLDRRVRLVRGRPRPLGMMAGLDDETDVVLLVGYHVRAGAGPGVLAHTMSPAVLDLRVQGQSVGEIGLNTILAGHHGASVVFLSGDNAACAEQSALVPSAVTVAVKQALGWGAAVTVHPALMREQLAEAAARAIRERAQVPLVTMTGPLEVEVDLFRAHTVDLATLIPGVRRAVGARTVAFTGEDIAEVVRMVLLLVQLGQIEPA